MTRHPYLIAVILVAAGWVTTWALAVYATSKVSKPVAQSVRPDMTDHRLIQREVVVGGGRPW